MKEHLHSSGGVERRRHVRLAHMLPLKIAADSSDIVTETINISCSGAYCRLNKHLEPMTKLKVTLLIPLLKAGEVTNQRISCVGVVVRSMIAEDKEHFYTAIYFSDISPKHIQLINDYIHQHVVS